MRRFRAKVGALPWPILSDPCAQAAATYGVAEQLFGVLEWVNRPSCFVVAPDGVLRWQYIGRELEDRPAVDDVLNQV